MELFVVRTIRTKYGDTLPPKRKYSPARPVYIKSVLYKVNREVEILVLFFTGPWMKCPWNCQTLCAFSFSSQLNRYSPITASSTNVREMVSAPLVWVRSWGWGWISISQGTPLACVSWRGWTFQVSNGFTTFRNWNLEITPHSHTSPLDVLPWNFSKTMTKL